MIKATKTEKWWLLRFCFILLKWDFIETGNGNEKQKILSVRNKERKKQGSCDESINIILFILMWDKECKMK